MVDLFDDKIIQEINDFLHKYKIFQLQSQPFVVMFQEKYTRCFYDKLMSELWHKSITNNSITNLYIKVLYFFSNFINNRHKPVHLK